MVRVSLSSFRNDAEVAAPHLLHTMNMAKSLLVSNDYLVFKTEQNIEFLLQAYSGALPRSDC